VQQEHRRPAAGAATRDQRPVVMCGELGPRHPRRSSHTVRNGERSLDERTASGPGLSTESSVECPSASPHVLRRCVGEGDTTMINGG
jgi:hypothetical protein